MIKYDERLAALEAAVVRLALNATPNEVPLVEENKKLRVKLDQLKDDLRVADEGADAQTKVIDRLEEALRISRSNEETRGQQVVALQAEVAALRQFRADTKEAHSIHAEVAASLQVEINKLKKSLREARGKAEALAQFNAELIAELAEVPADA